MSTKQLVPVVPYALGTVSVQQVKRLTIQNHVAVHGAIVHALAGWGYAVTKTQPSSIGGLETIIAERVEPTTRQGEGAFVQASLAEAIGEEWKRVQQTVARENQNPAHRANEGGQ